MNSNISTSIIIPTKNAGDNFLLILDAISCQKEIDIDKIVIIDSGSEDQTLSAAKRSNCQVVSIDPLSFNHGRTRNLGIELTQSHYVVLLTQDALLRGDRALVTMINSLINNEADGVYARQVPATDATRLTVKNTKQWISGHNKNYIFRYNFCNSFFSKSPGEQHLSSVFENVASVIRRESWQKVPFPESPFGEDLEWAFRILCNGGKIVFESNAEVIHSHDRPWWYTYQRTWIDHYKLYELFRMRTIPTLYHVFRSILITSYKDWSFLLTFPPGKGSWWKEFCSVPFHAWGSAWGQYLGAKAAAKGIPIDKLEGV